MGRRGVVAALAALAIGALTGCGADTAAAHYPTTPAPADRDRPAVFAALARVDPCAALRTAIRAQPRPPREVFAVPDSPHTCAVNLGRRGFVTVTVGVRVTAVQKFAERRVELGGAKGYQRALKPGDCTFHLPASFETAIEIGGPGGDCGYVHGLADAIAARLDRTANQPSTWDACSALNTLHRKGTLTPGAGTLGIDSCSLDSNALQLSYGDAPADTGERTTIAGHAVFLNQTGCSARWSQGHSGERNLNAELIVAANCPDLRDAVTTLIRALDGPPPATAPQHPLTYRPDEPDVPAAGACADYDPGQPCEPYHRAAIPAEDRIAAAAQDKNVACALALDAVRHRLGGGFRPVTTENSGCVFVEPTHRAQLRVRFGSGPISAAGLLDAQHGTVAGHPALTGEIRHGSGVAVGAGSGYALFSMEYRVEPSSGIAPGGDSPDVLGVPVLRPLAAEVVSRYLR